MLSGAGYELKIDADTSVQININERDGKPYEVFANNTGPVLFEWITALTILITRLLRAGQPLKDIGAELEEICGPKTSHMIPGTNIMSHSFVARIGRILRIHAEKLKEKNNGTCNNQE